MEKILFIFTKKLFPHFSTPTCSRFSGLFSELSENDPNSNSDQLINIFSEELEENPNIEKYVINPEKILNGIEKRNSVIIKGIPSAFGARNFYELLVKFGEKINFFFIPGFAINKWEYIYAFVTIRRKKGVLNIFKELNRIRDKKYFKGFNFSKIEIYFCKSRIIIGLTKKYQKENSHKNFIICQ